MKQENKADTSLIVRSLEVLEDISGGAMTRLATNVRTITGVGYTLRNDYEQFILECSDDGYISITEKPSLKMIWVAIQKEYLEIKANALAVGISSGTQYTAYVNAYNALDTYLNTTLAVFTDLTTATVVVTATFETKFSDYYTARKNFTAQIQSTVITQGGDNGAAKSAKYLGKFQAAHPSTHNDGDWWLVYDTDDSPIQRGVYYDAGSSNTRITVDSAVDLQGKMASAIMDIAWCETNGNGVAADYGFDTFFKSLAAISIFVNDLHAVNAEFLGTITSDPLSTTNNVTIDAHSAWGTSYSGITFNAYYAALPRKKIAASGTYNGTAYASIRNTGYSIEFYTSPETGNTLLGSVYRIDPTTSKNVASDAISIPATVVTQTLTPETAGTYDIGTSAKPYRMAYNLVRKPYALVKHSSITEADMFAWLQDKFEYAGLTQDANEEICCSGYDATDDVNFVYVVWYSATEFRIYGGHVSGCRYVTYLASGTGSDATHDVLFYM